MRDRIAGLMLVLSLAIVAAGCGGGGTANGTADLVPIPHILSINPPNLSFCKTIEGQLLVTVRNQGDGTAPASMTRVDFMSFGHTDQPTGPIAANGVASLEFEFPDGCFNSDCEFTITVDHDDQVSEEIEQANNSGSGTCIG